MVTILICAGLAACTMDTAQDVIRLAAPCPGIAAQAQLASTVLLRPGEVAKIVCGR